VVMGTNIAVGPGTFTILTTGTSNVAVGSGATGGVYSLSTGNRNVMLVANTGGGCEIGSNNTLGLAPQCMGGSI